MMTYTVLLTLIVKAPDAEAAKRLVNDRLETIVQDWFAEDNGNKPPYPSGALLYHHTAVQEQDDPAPRIVKSLPCDFATCGCHTIDGAPIQ